MKATSSAPETVPAAAAGARTPAGARGRIPGVDVARAVAIVGMVVVHFTLTDPTGAGGDAAALPDGPLGRVSLLFVLVLGVGVSLQDRSRSSSRRRTRQRLVWRAGVLLPLGLGLQTLGHGVSVILADLALVLLLAALVVGWSSRRLLGAAGMAFVAGPAVFVAVGTLWPGLVTGVAPALTDPPGQIVAGLLVGGVYPLVVHVGALLLGMWLGRLDLADPVLQVRMLAIAAVAALALLWAGAVLAAITPSGAPEWWTLAVDSEPHSQSFVWLWQASAAAVATLAVCLALGQWMPRLLRPLVALGQFAFTVYVGHILLMAADPELVRGATIAGAGLRVAAFLVVATLLAMGWLAVARRGPLEYVLDAPFVLRRPPAADRERDATRRP